MKFSVIIPLYNKKNYICRTLDSVLRQSFLDYEVIVVEDGSEDGSYEKVAAYGSEKIKIIRQKNQGVSVARNNGIACARGEYIAFLDADDEWESNYLETIDRLTAAYPGCGMYVTAYRIHMGNGRTHYSHRMEEPQGCIASYWLTYRYVYDFVWTSAVCIRKADITACGGFKAGEKIGQDLDLWSRIAEKNPKVAYSSDLCVNYNRAAEHNARQRVKIAEPKAFMNNLEYEMENPDRTDEELRMIQKKYDMKMTAYVYTSILAGKRSEARKALRTWKGRRQIKTEILKTALKAASVMPESVVRKVYALRLAVF